MLRQLQKKIEEFHMIVPGDTVFVGVSGGADSVCLLLVLLEIQKQMDFTLEVIHVEHGIRGAESKGDAAFVEELCKRYQLMCHKIEVDVPMFCEETGLGMEEAARILRYQAFSKLAIERNAKIALAHHQEDNAETMLFQLVRGSSLTGLCGIQPVRKDADGVCYIRPLLFSHRKEIEVFLEAQEMPWRVDSTNVELEYSRNFIRGKVIPELEKINAKAVEHMNQTAMHLSEVREYLDFETEKAWKTVVNVGDSLELDLKGLLELHPVLQREIAYKAIIHMAKRKKDITSAHVGDFIGLCKGQSGKKISLPYGIVAWKSFEVVYLKQNAGNKTDTLQKADCVVSQELLETLLQSGDKREIIFGEPAQRFSCRVFEKCQESIEIPRKTYTKWFDYDKIKRGFCIRTRRSGDYFISDDAGHRKKLKNYFIDEKIPVAEREKYYLLAQGSEVLWLIGGRISEHVKVSQKTKYIFEITYDGGNQNE